jgi:hypothetical protein
MYGGYNSYYPPLPPPPYGFGGYQYQYPYPPPPPQPHSLLSASTTVPFTYGLGPQSSFPSIQHGYNNPMSMSYSPYSSFDHQAHASSFVDPHRSEIISKQPLVIEILDELRKTKV